MFCLAGIGGRVSGIVKSTEEASAILAIDGFALDCAKRCLGEAGIAGFEHLRVTDLGMEKGKTPVIKENIARVANRGAERLAN